MLFIIICVLAEFCEYVPVHWYLIIFRCYLLALQAVCCSDKQHCCPSGYTCDVSAGTCNKGEDTMSWNAMAVRNVDRVSSSNVVCPGGQQQCDDDETCCQLQSGSYGCCPYSQVLHHFPLCYWCRYSSGVKGACKFFLFARLRSVAPNNARVAKHA